jgi:hypothetical protein
VGLLSSAIQILGLASLALGAFLIAVPIGFIIAGIALVLVGLAVGRD